MTLQKDRFARRRLRSAYATAIVSISLVLFMIGLLGLLMLHGHKLSVFVRENIALSIILNEEAREDQVKQLLTSLQAAPYSKSVSYITRDQAAKELQQALGEDFISFIGYNPLLPSFEVKLQAAWVNLDSIQHIEKKLLARPQVKEVVYQKTLVQQINDNIRKISLVLLALNVMLLIVAIALIHNTIRLAIYSRRFLIRSMQLVGATEAFIRKPFLRQGILQGFIGAAIALMLLALVLSVALNEIPELIVLKDYSLLSLLALGLVVFGISISFFSSFFAIHKFLRINPDNLYQ